MGAIEEILEGIKDINSRLDLLENNKEIKQNKIFNAEEAAGYLKVHENTIYKLWRKHKLAYVNIGKRKVSTLEQIEEYLERNSIKANQFKNNLRQL